MKKTHAPAHDQADRAGHECVKWQKRHSQDKSLIPRTIPSKPGVRSVWRSSVGALLRSPRPVWSRPPDGAFSSIGGREDGLRGAVVAIQGDDAGGRRELIREVEDVAHGRSAE